MNEITPSLREHLRGEGYEFGLRRADLEKRLRHLMGDERHARCQSALASYQNGSTKIENVYAFIENIAEGNLLMSQQADVVLAANAHLAHCCLQHAPRSGRLLDVGCWTGGLASFLAERRPDLDVVGVDRHAVLVQAASQFHHRPNLSFSVWDYAAGPMPRNDKFSLLACGVGLEFDTVTSRYYSVSSNCRREGHGYRMGVEEALPYFSNWRDVAEPDARLVTVLRIPVFAHAVAVLDAAAEAGWLLDLDKSKWITTGDERLPAIEFRAVPRATQVDEDEFLVWWVGERVQEAEGDAALLRYRLLARKQIIREWRQEYPDGHVVRREVGLADGAGYALTLASTGCCRLQRMSAAEAEQVLCDFQM